jgi:outer membrane protein TolC
MPHRDHHGRTLSVSIRQRGVIAVLGCALLALSACKSPRAHREQADATAARIIDNKQQAALGRSEPFTIERPAETLRRRLLKAQGLPASHPASYGADRVEPVEHWPEKSNYLDKPRWAPPPVVEQAADHPIRLSLDQALQVAALNSREYQSQKESVFRTALDLDLERDAFRNTYAGLVESLLIANPGTDPDQLGLENTGEASLERRLKSGATLSTRLILDLAQLLRPDDANSAGIFADLSITIPLLAGSGRHIVAEPLTQAERNVLYALWQFERFKRTFAVRVATDYLQVLQQLDVVRNAENNYRRLIDSAQRSRALADAGRLSEIDVDQVNQDVLRARDSWIRARERYQQQVDQYKVLLGLPTDAHIGLDPAELNRLAETAAEALGEARAAAAGRPEGYVVEDGEIRIQPPGEVGAGPLELDPRRAVELALGERLDLRTAQQRVADAQRKAVVAADALRAGLALSGAAAIGERRGIASADQADADFRFDEGRYSVGLAVDLPWEKTAERIAYRNALIDLEAAVRDVQEAEDGIKLAVRNALRQLEQARESYRIQVEAVALAERRVESSSLFLQAGRAEIRDVLEAEEALVNAQDALTDALVTYRVTELEFQRDAGVLRVDHQGLWREYEPDNDRRGGG